MQLKSLLAALTIGGTSALALAQGNGIRPITNPVYFDQPDVVAQIHPIFIQQNHPDTVNLALLGETELGGNHRVYALQFEIPITTDLSLIAVKDGYIDFNPDSTLSSDEGMADLGAGLKYVFHRCDRIVASARLTVELPIGDDVVWQGNGKGTINPGVSVMGGKNGLQLAGTLGGTLGLDEEDSDMLYASAHLSKVLSHGIVPVLEMNYWRVLSEGDGGKRFNNQADGAVPAVARWEGGDLVNLGASNAGDNPDFLTLAVGARLQLSEAMDLGGAYEFPLTNEKNSLMDSRVTLDLVFRF